MGAYGRVAASADSLLYTKQGPGGTTLYLYRAASTGCWMATATKAHMDRGKGILRSKSAADLPTQEGLKWQYYSSGTFAAVTGAWRDDDAMVCTPLEQGRNKVTLSKNTSFV